MFFLFSLFTPLIENPVKRLAVGRIAAKFSAPKEQIEESSKPSSSAVSSGNTSGTGNDPTIGRGRGLLGELRLSALIK